MIQRVALHQTRFRAPGLVPDARGVALGPVGLVLLSSPERLVSFLRATGEEGALDELLDSLRIVQVISPLRTREMIVEVQANSSHRMDRLNAIARLLGGLVFTGSGRHFVKYRDTASPLGYDVQELDAVETPPREHGTVHSGVGFAGQSRVPDSASLQQAADILNPAARSRSSPARARCTRPTS